MNTANAVTRNDTTQPDTLTGDRRLTYRAKQAAGGLTVDEVLGAISDFAELLAYRAVDDTDENLLYRCASRIRAMAEFASDLNGTAIEEIHALRTQLAAARAPAATTSEAPSTPAVKAKRAATRKAGGR